jgi:DnaJ-class molecular chaperone
MAKKICPYCEGRGCHITQCPNCSGTGKVKCERHRQTFIELFTGCKNCGDTGKVSCYKCAGKGTVNLGSIAVFGEEGICKACGGKGRVPTTVPEPNEAEKCPECHGKGIVKRTYFDNVTFPRRTQDSIVESQDFGSRKTSGFANLESWATV